MDLNAVRIFVAVLQAGSLTQASERLNEIDDLLLEKMARWSELDD